MQTEMCSDMMDYLFGPSVDQRNYSMQPVYNSHEPCGCSLKQILHFGQEINWCFFGKYMTDSNIPSNYDLSQIKVPVSLHYSPVDKFTNPKGKKSLLLNFS